MWISSKRRVKTIEEMRGIVEGGGVLECRMPDRELAREFVGWALGRFGYRRLGRAEKGADSVDTVLLTHLHVDHIGWNTTKRKGNWVPTFSNARYLVAEEEFTFFRDLDDDTYGDLWGESVRPVLDAGLMDIVQADHHADEGVWFEPTPGHTPGHVSVRISSQGEDAVITGDMIHHPYAIGRPHWDNPAIKLTLQRNSDGSLLFP